MGEAIDALHELETRHLDDAKEVMRIATLALDAAEGALASAEGELIAHDERVAAKLAPQTTAVSIESLARDDAYRRAMRLHRLDLVEAVREALEAREQAAEALEVSQTALAGVRARLRAVEGRLEARAAERRKAALAREEDEADEHRRG